MCCYPVYQNDCVLHHLQGNVPSAYLWDGSDNGAKCSKISNASCLILEASVVYVGGSPTRESRAEF